MPASAPFHAPVPPIPRARGATQVQIARRTLLGMGLGAAGAGMTGGGMAGSMPTAEAAGQGRRRGWIESRLTAMTLEQKIGQLFVMHVYGADADTPDPRNTEAYGVATPAEVVAKYHLGGVIYFTWSENLPDPQAGAHLSNGLQRAAMALPNRVQIPLTIATDQETGLVARMPAPATVFPGAMALGAAREPELTRETYRITGQELRAIGITCDYAPDADVNINPANPVIGVRSFSSDPDLVSELVVAGVEGLQGAGVSATAKHFPGHGDTDVDSHYGFPVITHTREEWDRFDAPPFRAAIEAGVDSIMTAHLDFPALDPSGDPATLSKPIITGLLREELGFDRVVVTDGLGMAGVREKYGDAEVAVRAIEAGVDVLLQTPAADDQYDALLEAVRSGRLSVERLDESVARILGMKFDRGLTGEFQVDEDAVVTIVGSVEHRQRAQEITDHSITLLRDDAELVPLPDGSVYVTGYGETTTAALAAALADQGHEALARPTGADPTEDDIARAVEESGAHAVTVVLTHGADASPSQQRLVLQIREAGRAVVVVAVRTPYDIAALEDVETFLASYGYQAVSMVALAKVLAGEVLAAGRLPVSIPRADDPEVELYEFGAGIDQ